MSDLVVHCHKSSFDVYIGRPSKWGNPFKLGFEGHRKKVIQQYAEWILTQPELLKSLGELTGKVLGCYCAPLACHGDVLSSFANALCDSPLCVHEDPHPLISHCGEKLHCIHMQPDCAADHRIGDHEPSCCFCHAPIPKGGI